MNAPFSLTNQLTAELDRTGWSQAYAHFLAAAKALRANDTALFDAEMAAFRRIQNTWRTA